MDCVAATFNWREMKSHRSARTSSRRVAVTHTMGYTWDTEPSFTIGQPCLSSTAVRWRRFLSLASHGDARCGCARTPCHNSITAKWRVEHSRGLVKTATDYSAITANTSVSGACKTNRAVNRWSAC